MVKKKRSKVFRKKNQVIDMEQARVERQKRRSRLVKKEKNKSSGPRSKRKANKMARRRFFYLIILVCLIIVVAYTAIHVVSLQKSAQQEKDNQAALIKEKARLTEELEQVNSGEYVEDKARTELHMVKPGETIYVVPQEEPKKTSEPAVKETK